MKQKYSIDFYKKATLSSLWSSSYHETGRPWGREARDSVVCKISLMWWSSLSEIWKPEPTDETYAIHVVISRDSSILTLCGLTASYIVSSLHSLNVNRETLLNKY